VAQWVKIRGGTFPQEVEMMVQNVARVGGTPLVVARGKDVLGVIYLKDIVKGGIRERFARLRAMGIRTVMVTGDNALTAASIAAGAGGRQRLPRGAARGRASFLKNAEFYWLKMNKPPVSKKKRTA